MNIEKYSCIRSCICLRAYMVLLFYAMVGVPAGMLGRGVVMGTSWGVGSVGGAELGVGTSSGGGGVSDECMEVI